MLSDIFSLFGKPDLDLFASRLNHQLPRYVSWIPDPNAVGVDAFTLDWGTQYNCFSSLQFNSTSSAKGGGGSSRSNHGDPSLANAVLVSQINQTPGAAPSATSQSSQHCTPALQSRKGTSIGGKTAADGMSLIRESLRNKGISERAQELILQSWRAGTQKQYRTYLQRWTTFNSGRDIDPIQPTISEVIDFLTELFDSGLGYSGLNTARCALSSVIHLDDNKTVGSHPLVNRFLKAAFNNRPSIPRYQSVWDPTRVLTYLKTLPLLRSISLKELTHKLVMLIALVTRQRCQSLHLMDITSVQQNADHYKFVIKDIVKQSSPGRNQPELILPAFPADCRVCVYSVLSEYIKCTTPLRGGETRLFISFVKALPGSV